MKIKKVRPLNERVIGIYGTTAAPVQICQALTQLQVSHSTLMSDFNLGFAQPSWVGVIPGVSYMPRYTSRKSRQILFICDSLALLSTCNIRILNTNDITMLGDVVKRALEHSAEYPLEDWELVRNEPTTNEYVHSATKPSYLNFIQTALYKISNYPLRKEVQGLIIKYLNSDIKLQPLMVKLNSNLKLQELAVLLKDEKAVVLRNAVAAFRTSKNLEAVSKEFKTETFEILYVTNSAIRNQGDV